VAVTSLTVALASTSIANAAATLELTRGSAEPVESVTTQLGANISNGSGGEFFLHVKPTGGTGCGANPGADIGEDVISESISGEVNPVPFTRNWTFQLAGNYRACGWVTGYNDTEVLAHAETEFHVRQPRLALSVSVPAIVTPGETFQVVMTAQAETERTADEYMLPNTGDGCPANADAAYAAAGSRSVLVSWSVTGGPVVQSRNESIEAPAAS
jgi:hypothetical protein